MYQKFGQLPVFFALKSNISNISLFTEFPGMILILTTHSTIFESAGVRARNHVQLCLTGHLTLLFCELRLHAFDCTLHYLKFIENRAKIILSIPSLSLPIHLSNKSKFAILLGIHLSCYLHLIFLIEKLILEKRCLFLVVITQDIAFLVSAIRPNLNA